jgi:Ethanolamine utilization protein EutJ (predicted chaperonin)
MKVSGGIDLGKTGTREIYLESHWKKVKVVEGSKQVALTGAVPSHALTFRRFSLPFHDRKRVREIVKEELTDMLAFPLEEARWDFTRGADNDVFVIIARSDMVKETLESLGRPCEMLDAEPYGLARTALYCGIKDALIIDFGATKTVFCALRNGDLEWIKVLLSGGDALTKLMSETRKLSLHDAEELKRSQGIQLPEVKESIIKLLRTANLPSPFPYPAIVITGGGACLEGLREFLGENLKTPVSTFTLPDDLSPFSDAVAFGMALKGNREYIQGVNLAEEKKHETNPLIFWMAALLLPLLLFSTNLVLRENNLRVAVKKYKQEMENVYKKDFPGETHGVSPVKLYKAKLDEKKALMQSGGSDALALIDKISRVVARKDIHIFQIDLSDQEITLSGETASYQEVEVMRKALLESFKNVELREGKTLPSKRITFTLILSLKEKDSHAEKSDKS